MSLANVLHAGVFSTEFDQISASYRVRWIFTQFRSKYSYFGMYYNSKHVSVQNVLN